MRFHQDKRGYSDGKESQFNNHFFTKRDNGKLKVITFLMAEIQLQRAKQWPLLRYIRDYLDTHTGGKELEREIVTKYGVKIQPKVKTIFEESDNAVNQAKKEIEELEILIKPLDCFSCKNKYIWGSSAGNLECRGHYNSPSLTATPYAFYPCCKYPFISEEQARFVSFRTSELPYCTRRDHSTYPTNARDTENIPFWLIILVFGDLDMYPQKIITQALDCHLVSFEPHSTVSTENERKTACGSQSLCLFNDKYPICLVESYIKLPYMTWKRKK